MQIDPILIKIEFNLSPCTIIALFPFSLLEILLVLMITDKNIMYR